MSDLWKRIEAIFEWHQKPEKDTSSIQALNRLAQEQVQSHDLPPLAPLTDKTSFSVLAASWPINELAKLPRRHARTKPAYDAGPVVVLQHYGYWLLDGNNRINKWISENSTIPHEVLIVKPSRANDALD